METIIVKLNQNLSDIKNNKEGAYEIIESILIDISKSNHAYFGS